MPRCAVFGKRCSGGGRIVAASPPSAATARPTAATSVTLANPRVLSLSLVAGCWLLVAGWDADAALPNHRRTGQP